MKSTEYPIDPLVLGYVIKLNLPQYLLIETCNREESK